MRRDSSRDDAGFYRAMLLDTRSQQERILFTFWDADPFSGFSLGTRWSDDSKALRLKGKTRGFRYHFTKDEPFEFDLIYLADDDEMFSLDEETQ